MLLTLLLAQRATQLPVVDLTGKPLVTIAEPVVQPNGFAELPNHRAVIVDGKDNRIALVDFARNSLTTLGRQGAGPVEYRHPMGAFAAPAGGAIVPDLGNRRAVLINAAGVITGTGYTREEMGVGGAGQIRGVDRTGLVYLFGGLGNGDVGNRLPIVTWQPVSHHVDTIAWWPQVPVTHGPMRKSANGATTTELMTFAMFPPRTEWLMVTAGGIVKISPQPYHVEFIDSHGKSAIGPAVVRTPIPLDATERDAYRNQRGPIPDKDFPSQYPPFSGINDAFVAPDSQVWVERSRRFADSTAVYDIFDRNGKLSAQARLRPNSHLVGIGRDMVYVVRQTTDDDFWYVEEWQRPH
ncbi:MAG TPA: hypothetical protein VGM77_01495 [Gemmatimonadales bacterium]|jgi:hypothetical protein